MIHSNPTRRRGALLLLSTAVLCLALIANSHADSNPEFSRMSLPYGIAIDVPAHWYVIPDTARKNLSMAGNAIAEQSGFSQAGRMKHSLLNVNATPTPTGAMIRVSFTVPSDFTAAELRAMTASDLHDIREFLESGMRAAEAHGGPKIIEVLKPQVIQLKGHTTLYMPYRRLSPVTGDSWFVEMWKIPKDDGLIELTLSHREKDGLIWAPINQHIEQSISF